MKYYYLVLTCFVASLLPSVARSAYGQETTAQIAMGCSTCNTQSEATVSALSYVKAKRILGIKTIEVVNTNTAQTWFVTTDFFPADFPNPVADSVYPGTATDNATARAVLGFYKTDVTVAIGAGDRYASNPAFSSFTMWSQDQICPVLYAADSANPDFQTTYSSVNYNLLVNLMKQLLGRSGPTATLVFLNGDVAQFVLIPGQPEVCTYKPGSARDRFGNFIMDKGLGGNGISDGNPYVNAPNPWAGYFEVSAFGTGGGWLSCTWIGGSLVGCVKEF